MKNKAMVYSGWLQIALAIAIVPALRWEHADSPLSDFAVQFWWVWPVVLMLIVMGVSTIVRNRL